MSSDDRGEEKYFEDYVPGTVRTFGNRMVTEEEIVEFGKRYDPQVFHVDPDAARRSVYGGLVASGWQTAAMAMLLIVENYLSPSSSMGSPGVDELRWLKPVRPGDILSVRLTILEATRSRSKPDRGTIRSLVEVLNQDGVVVMTWKGLGIIRARSSER